MLILITTQIEGPVNTDKFTDFLDISMDGADDHNKLDNYLSQPLEKVHDPIVWWWEHQVMFPMLSAMAFNYLSISGALFLVCHLCHTDPDNVCRNLNCS
jgi:hypothetical protein